MPTRPDLRQVCCEVMQYASEGAANGTVRGGGGLKVGPGVSLAAEESYRVVGAHGGHGGCVGAVGVGNMP